MAIRNAGESANMKSYYIKQTLREADSEVPWNPALRIAETVRLSQNHATFAG